MAAHQFKLLHGSYEELTNVEYTPPPVVQPTVTYKTKMVYKPGDIINTDLDLSTLYDQPGSQAKFQKIF